MEFVMGYLLDMDHIRGQAAAERWSFSLIQTACFTDNERKFMKIF